MTEISTRIIALLEQRTRDRIAADGARFHVGFKYNAELWDEVDRLNALSLNAHTQTNAQTDTQTNAQANMQNGGINQAAPVEECDGWRVTVEYTGLLVRQDVIESTAAIMRAVDMVMMSRHRIEINIDLIGIEGATLEAFSRAFHSDQ